jgi:cysteinyl-tRNA synthetase
MSIRIYDTHAGEKRDFETIEPGKVRMYVCGVTPYARSHIGHARSALVYDLIYRYLRYSGLEVTYVRNFTDVDDKIIARANEEGIEAPALAARFIDSYHEDMDALGVARPDQEPRVSTSMDAIIALVKRLIERDVAYAVDGDVYYAVDRFEGYGKLSKKPLEDLEAGARVEVDGRKRNPMDFALWKSAKPGEPSWDSPWGKGRPGWHIECSAMSMEALGESIDLHGGGQDLIFPHHENEIAQSEGATGCEFARFWVHNGFVNIDDEKMSKSLGNCFGVPDLKCRYEPQVVRYFMLASTHYRHPINFGDALLDEAAARVAYFYETLRKVGLLLDEGHPEFDGPLPHQALIEELEPRFREAMDDDFNAPRAISVVYEGFKALNELAQTRKKKHKPSAGTAARRLLDALMRIDEVFNLFGEPPREYLARHTAKAAMRRGLDEAWIADRVEARRQARDSKDWAAADAARDELLARGVVLMDTPDGTEWAVLDVAGGAAEG